MTFPNLYRAIGVIATVGLAACSQGGNPSSGGDGKAFSGSVLGSYIVGATICIDENENGRCDTSDSFRTTTTTKGAYSFADVPDDIFSKTIIVEVPENASIVDPITGISTPATSEYRLAFPPSSDQERFVSSLSTLVNSEFNRTGSLDSAKQSVSDAIGVGSPDDLLSNYVETGAENDAATDDERTLYNVSKLVGNTMQSAQSDTVNDLNNDTNLLLNLVTEKILENINTIESAAREANGIMTQEEAASLAGDIVRNSNLTISTEELATAEDLANTPFNLGQVKMLTINNIEEEGQSGWQRQIYAEFKTPQANTLSLNDFKESIPAEYELGLYDDAGTLVAAYGFNEPQGEETSSIRYYYEFYDYSSSDTRFTLFARDYESEQFSPGDYTFELCTTVSTGCSNLAGTEGQIEIGTKTIIALEESKVTPVSELTALITNQDIDFYTSAGDEMVSNGNQAVFVNAPAPPIGARGRVEFGPDSDGQDSNGSYQPEINYQSDTLSSFNRIDVPKDEYDQFVTDDLVVRLKVRDAVDYEDVSYISSTLYKPLSGGIERRESFLMEEFFDIYQTDNFKNRKFVEGGRVESRIFIADDNPLVGLWFEDENEAKIGSNVCLPSNMPTNQAEIANLTYELQHRGDGKSEFFEGCENVSIQSMLNIAPVTEGDSELRIIPLYNNEFDVNYLEVRVGVRSDDTDNIWSESVVNGGLSVNFLKDIYYIVFEYQNGSIQKHYLDIPVPEANHVFSEGTTENWDIDICHTEQGNLKVNFSAPGWMNEEFVAGKLTMMAQISGYNEMDEEIDNFFIYTLRGAKSVIVTNQILEVIDDNPDAEELYIQLMVGDMDYYDWKKRTWWSAFTRIFTREEVEQAGTCLT